MPTTCGFPNCKFRSRYRGQEDNRHFYRIPKRPPQLRLRWLDAIGRSEETVVSQVKKQLRICSAHFTGGEKREGDIPVADPQIDPPSFITLPGRDRRATGGNAIRGLLRRSTSAAAKRTKSLLNRSSKYLANGSNRNNTSLYYLPPPSFLAASSASPSSTSLPNFNAAAAAAAAAVVAGGRATGNDESHRIGCNNNGGLMMRVEQESAMAKAESENDGRVGGKQQQRQRPTFSHRSEDRVPSQDAAHLAPPRPPPPQFNLHSPVGLAVGTCGISPIADNPVLGDSHFIPELSHFNPFLTSGLTRAMSKNTTPTATLRPLVALLDGRDCSIEMPLLKDIATVAFCDAQSTSEIHEKVLNEAVAAFLYHSITLSREDLLKFKALKLVVRVGSNPDNVDIDAATELGIAVCGTPAECVEEKADSTMSLILNLFRKTHWIAQENAKAITNGRQLNSMEQVKELVADSKRIRGSVLGLVGFGRVGMAVACRAKAFGFLIAFYDPYAPNGIERACGVERYETLGELLSKADCLSFHCPLTAETNSLLNVESIQRMKFGSYLVNNGASELVSKSALLAALKRGHIKRAALDIYDRAGKDDEMALEALSQLPSQVIITPHCGWYSGESAKEVRTATAREIRRALTGRIPEDLRCCVNKEALIARNYGSQLMGFKQNGLPTSSTTTAGRMASHPLFQPPLPYSQKTPGTVSAGGIHPLLNQAAVAANDSAALGNFSALAAAGGLPSDGALGGLAYPQMGDASNPLGVLGTYPTNFLMSLNPQLFGQALLPAFSQAQPSNPTSLTPASSTQSAEGALQPQGTTANMLGAKSNSIVDRLAAKHFASGRSGEKSVKEEEKIGRSPNLTSSPPSRSESRSKSIDNNTTTTVAMNGNECGSGETAEHATKDENSTEVQAMEVVEHQPQVTIGITAAVAASGVKRKHESDDEEHANGQNNSC